MSKRTSSDLYLAAGQQEDIMVAALKTNQAGTSSVPGSGQLSFDDESPYLDFDNDGEFDDSFDLDPDARMIGDLPGEQLPTNDELHDKRKSMDGKDGDDEGGRKRREGEDKTGKRPGRKPLTSEPTSKRKAQNRAAQRAFRERKEKHLRDLETKVEDLERSSEAASHENDLLKAQVERLQVELKEYRKRLSWISSGGIGRSNSIGRPSSFNNQSDFQFEFPKFGDMPQPSSSVSTSGNSPSNGNVNGQKSQEVNQTRASTAAKGNGAIPTPGAVVPPSRSDSQPRAPSSVSQSPLHSFTASPRAVDPSGSVDSLSSLFSPSIIESARHGSFGSYFSRSHTIGQNNNISSSSLSHTNSPTSSSESQHTASSIGTSPEPSLSSPANRQPEGGKALNTINETQSESSVFAFGTTPNPAADFTVSTFDPSTFNLVAAPQPNLSEFDPILFGDYRESQDNLLSQDFGSFFNDAYPLPDLGSPSHNFNELSTDQTVAVSARAALMKQAEITKDDNDEAASDSYRPMTCNKIWDRLQSMEKFRNGEIDIDNLCSELRAKAKCSEGGAVVDKKDVDKILGQAK
ncbi:hypothetical protein DV738_g1380, partial [Chaetothyriales sp. CBS 135597]